MCPSPQPTDNATTIWERFGCKENPPEPCEFTIGQHVIFTNDYGLEFEMDVIGFSEDTSFQGRFIHTIVHGTDGKGSAWWFPHRPSELRAYENRRKVVR